MKLVIKLGTAHNDFFLTGGHLEEETANLETAKVRIEKDFKIYHIDEFDNKIVAYVY